MVGLTCWLSMMDEHLIDALEDRELTERESTMASSCDYECS